MASFGIDHAIVTCPHYKRELRRAAVWMFQVLKVERSEGQHRRRAWALFFDPDTEWDDILPGEVAPFGLCGWCWRVYTARRKKAAR